MIQYALHFFMLTESNTIYRISPEHAKRRNVAAPLLWLLLKKLASIDDLSIESEKNLLSADRYVDKSSIIIYTNPVSDLNHLTAILTLLTTYLSNAKTYAFSSLETEDPKKCANKFKAFIKALEWLHVYVLHSVPKNELSNPLVFDLLTMNGGVYITDTHNELLLQEQVRTIPIPIYVMPLSITQSGFGKKAKIVVGNPQTISSNQLTNDTFKKALTLLEKK